MSVITQDFVAAGKPTYITANAGVMYTDITDGIMYRQTTIPFGKNWKVISNQNVFIPNSGVTTVSASTPLASTGGNTPNITIQQAGPTQDGYLSSADWNTFNSAGGVPTTRAINTTTPLQGGGDLSADRTLSIPKANNSTDGYLSSADWNTFNNKGSGTVTAVTATSPITSSGGATPSISIPQAGALTDGFLSSTDWGVFNGKFPYPTGTTSQYVRGDGSLATFPTIPGVNDSITHATASGTDTYTATITGVTSYADGDAYLIRFTNGNTTGATLNINSLGAVDLYRNNDGIVIGGDIEDGAEMLLVYNSTLVGFQCIGTSPNTLLSYVTNADSVTITRGQPVYAFGGVGDRLTVKLAYNTTDATSAQTIGVVQSTSIAAGQKGLIIMQGQLDNLSIFPTATWSDGDPVYLGATAGALTKIKPYAPNHLVYIGYVLTASNGSAGRMYVRPQNGYELKELHDVSAQTPSNNDGLFYNTTTSLWESKSISTALGYTPANASTAVTSVTGTSPVVSSGGTTPAISIPVATSSADGYLSSTDWSTFNSKMTSFMQYRKAGRWFTNGMFNPQGAAFTNVANTIRYVPFYLDQDITVTRMGINVVTAGAASSTCRLGIYTNNGTNNQPSTRLVDTGTIDLVATGPKSVTGLSVALTKGLYWFAYFGSSASGSITAVGANFVFDIKGQANIASIGFVGFNQSLTYTSLPASAGTLTEVNGTTTVAIFYYY
jgi:hypothetical protein